MKKHFVYVGWPGQNKATSFLRTKTIQETIIIPFQTKIQTQKKINENRQKKPEAVL